MALGLHISCCCTRDRIHYGQQIYVLLGIIMISLLLPSVVKSFQIVRQPHHRIHVRVPAIIHSRLFSTSTSSSGSSKQRKGNFLLQSGNTGGLRRLPVVKAPPELVARAWKQARWIKADVKVKNARNRARKHGAETLNSFSQSLCIPLRDMVKGYRREWRNFHPFERVVADLTVTSRQYRDGLSLESLLVDIHEARKCILEATKDWIYQVKEAPTAREANERTAQGLEALAKLFDQFAASPVAGISDLQRELRSAPTVALDTPAVVLVGAPNVGKSSMVRALSSATPEVNNYPFTTRGMTLGHVEVFWAYDNDGNHNDGGDENNPEGLSRASIAKAVVPDPDAKRGKKSDSAFTASSQRYAFSQLCQVMDSPGLLVRDSEDDRNNMEALTLAAMQHLPTAVLYVLDLSGGAGDSCSSIADQLTLRRQVRARFPKRPWIDVIAKSDLGYDDSIDCLKQLEAIRQENPSDLQHPYIELSIHEETGVTELRTQVLRMLGEVQVVLDAMSATMAGSSTGSAGTTSGNNDLKKKNTARP